MPEKRCTEKRLTRVNPILRRSDPEMSTPLRDGGNDPHQSQHSHKGDERNGNRPAEAGGEERLAHLPETASNEISESTHVDPDQVLRRILAEMEGASKHKTGQSDRNAFRVLSIVIILVGLLASLWILEWMLSELPRPNHPQSAPITAPEQKR